MAKDFSHQNLRNTKFANEDLSHASFINADLRGADFSGSNLAGPNLSKVKTGITPLNIFLIFNDAGDVSTFGLHRHAGRSYNPDHASFK